MFVGARRSSPGMEELRYNCGRGLREEDDCILPVKGARSDCEWRGSSRSSMFAERILFRILNVY